MEPLSAAASIVTLVQITAQLAAACRKYYKGVTNAHRDMQQLISELTIFSDALVDLQELYQNLGNSPTGISNNLSGIDKVINSCKLDLQDLNSQLQVAQQTAGATSSRKTVISKWKWPFKESDVFKIIARLERYKGSLALGLHTDNLATTHAIGSDVKDVQVKLDAIKSDHLATASATEDGFKEVQSELDRIKRQNLTASVATEDGISKIQAKLNTLRDNNLSALLATSHGINSVQAELGTIKRDAQHSKIMAWLAASDPSTNHNAARAKHEPNTGNWWLEDDRFKGWRTRPNSFIWLHGKAGCGKSILSSTISDKVQDLVKDQPRSAVAYSYFDFNDSKKQNTEAFLSSIVTQLYKATASDLHEILEVIMKSFDEVFVIVDAIDECPATSNERKNLLGSINKIHEQNVKALRFLMTSRKEQDIFRAMTRPQDQAAKQCIDIQSDILYPDICLYVDSKLQLTEFTHWPANLQQTVAETLKAQADGMFRWVALQLDHLKGIPQKARVLKALRTLPRTLDETYDRMFGAIDEDLKDQAITAVQLLACSDRPLLMRELAEAVLIRPFEDPSFDPEDRYMRIDDILQLLPGLIIANKIYIRGDHGLLFESEIRFAHFSVKEYLCSARIQQGPISSFQVIESKANLFVAEICLAYVLRFADAEICSFSYLLSNSFLVYAAKHWTEHVSKCPLEIWSASFTSKYMTLMESHGRTFINWVKIWDPDGESYSQREAIPCLENWWHTSVTEHECSYETHEGFLHLETNSTWQIAPPLYYSAHCRSVHAASLLISNGCDVNASGGYWGSALGSASASTSACAEVVELLLKAGAKPDVRNGFNGTVLAIVTGRGNLQILDSLLRHGADCNLTSESGALALSVASFRGHLEITKALLEHGADVNAHDGHYGSALMAAITYGHLEIIKALLEHGADVDIQDGHHGSALIVAITRGHIEIIKALLEHGADVNAQDGHHGSALIAAIARGHLELAESLLGHGADVNLQINLIGSALSVAAAGGYLEIAKLLLTHGADINAQNPEYGSALIAASARGHLEITELLLARGADVRARGGYGDSALQEAASCRGSLALMELLLERGADVNTQDVFGRSPLHAALISRVPAQVELLLKYGANVHLDSGYYGSVLETAITYADTDASFEMVELVLKYGAEFGTSKKGYGSALQAAAAESILEVLQCLLKHGADLKTQGYPALMEARKKKAKAGVSSIRGAR
ncbi:MAG: hypothetical protein M1814_005903 [Vezdaea aestivalis]|nr:MAG: hypothetical protein M1814_005903 [Vezdaea aestivalis]